MSTRELESSPAALTRFKGSLNSPENAHLERALAKEVEASIRADLLNGLTGSP
jgi:hypothetical protein